MSTLKWDAIFKNAVSISNNQIVILISKLFLFEINVYLIVKVIQPTEKKLEDFEMVEQENQYNFGMQRKACYYLSTYVSMYAFIDRSLSIDFSHF